MNFRYCLPRTRSVALLAGLLAPAAAIATPKIVVKEPEVDLGTMKQQSIRKHTFTIENHGTSPLEIKSIKSSCACTAPQLRPHQRVVPPGKSVKIPVTFNSKGKFGNIHSKVSVQSNDPNTPLLDLRLHAFVETLCVISPQSFYLTNAGRGRISTQHVEIMPGGENAALEVLELKSDLPGLEVITEEHKISEKNQTGVRVKVRPGRELPLGRISTKLTGKIRVGQHEKAIQIPVNGTLVGELIIQPLYVMNPRAAKRGARISMITIRANKGVTIAVNAAIPRDNAIDAHLIKQKPGKLYRVNLNLAKDAPGGPIATVVDLYTDSADQPIASVPVLVIAEPVVKVTPTAVTLDASAPDRGKQTVTLTAPDNSPITVENVECPDPDMITRIASDANDKHVARVEVWLKPDSKPGEHYTRMIVKTDFPGAERLIIPIQAVAPGRKKVSADGIAVPDAAAPNKPAPKQRSQ